MVDPRYAAGDRRAFFRLGRSVAGFAVVLLGLDPATCRVGVGSRGDAELRKNDVLQDKPSGEEETENQKVHSEFS